MLTYPVARDDVLAKLDLAKRPDTQGLAQSVVTDLQRIVHHGHAADACGSDDDNSDSLSLLVPRLPQRTAEPSLLPPRESPAPWTRLSVVASPGRLDDHSFS